ncbi:hypothetical protein BKI52_32825 [marine bacterium AO1-C]|nr:hypothetical protein BKI52_32825 [marine bacterium AO1-C]
MNCQQAKEIPMTEFLARLGLEPSYQYTQFWWYKDPVTNENRASLKVNLSRNTWKNEATGEAGNIIKFVIRLKGGGISQALQFIAITMNKHLTDTKTSYHNRKPMRITKIKKLGNNKALTDYLNSRGISLELALPYLKEVYYYIGEKHYFALGWQNEKYGWELRSKYTKIATKKTYTFIEGAGHPLYHAYMAEQEENGDEYGGPDTKCYCNVFEGMFDYLSALVYTKRDRLYYDTIILNGIGMLNLVLPLLREYYVINLFLDNDSIGLSATKSLVVDQNFVDRSNIYKPHKDFNEFLMYKTCTMARKGKK